MSKWRVGGSVFGVVLACVATVAWACPEESKTTTASAKSGCDKSKVEKVADKAGKPCGAHKHGKTVADESSKPCCAKKDAKTVADKPCCAKKGATTADTKGGCNKSKAVKVADKPCCAKKSAKTADAKGGCNKPCGSKATTVADSKGGSRKPCGSKATTVADSKGGCSKPCGSKAKTVADDEGGCKIGAKVEAILASLPAMKYQVGDQEFCCAKAAGYVAGKEKKEIQYVVGDAKFATEAEAEAKRASILDAELQSMTAMQYAVGGESMRCPMSAKSAAKSSNSKVMYRVAGFDFETKEQAEKAAKLVADAVAHVGMSYKVGDKTFKCSKSAGAKCKEAGTKLTYVVNEQETGCEVMAKSLLSEAKIRAAVETAAHTYAETL